MKKTKKLEGLKNEMFNDGYLAEKSSFVVGGLAPKGTSKQTNVDHGSYQTCDHSSDTNDGFIPTIVGFAKRIQDAMDKNN